MQYVVYIALERPTYWQQASEAIHGPFLNEEDARPLINQAVADRADRIVVFPLNSSSTEPLVYHQSMRG